MITALHVATLLSPSTGRWTCSPRASARGCGGAGANAPQPGTSLAGIQGGRCWPGWRTGRDVQGHAVLAVDRGMAVQGGTRIGQQRHHPVAHAGQARRPDHHQRVTSRAGSGGRAGARP
jgi:hypothetical protein